MALLNNQKRIEQFLHFQELLTNPESIVSSLTIRQKVAQMIYPGIRAAYYPKKSYLYRKLYRLVNKEGIGGIVLFKGGVNDYVQIVTEFQGYANIPLLFSADFERGAAMRIESLNAMPHHFAIRLTDSPENAYTIAKAVAQEANALGIDHNFAPVADLLTDKHNPIVNIRGFSADPYLSGRYCQKFVLGTESQGIISTLKHFPGHGRTTIDSHNDLPILRVSEQTLLSEELIPFKMGIEMGASSVMIGHLAVPAIDKKENLPATLSRGIVTELLREELQYKGLIVTDAMNMNAVCNYYSAADAAVASIGAGVDMLLMPPDEDIALDAVVAAVKRKVISEEQIDMSVLRILSAKKRRIVKSKLFDEKASRFLGSPEYQRTAERIAVQSITSWKLKAQELQRLTQENFTLLVLSDSAELGSEMEFIKKAETSLHILQTFLLHTASSHAIKKNILSLSETRQNIIVAIFSRIRAYQGTTAIDPYIQKIINNCILNKKAIFITAGNPFLIKYFPQLSKTIILSGDISAQCNGLFQLLQERSMPKEFPVMELAD